MASGRDLSDVDGSATSICELVMSTPIRSSPGTKKPVSGSETFEQVAADLSAAVAAASAPHRFSCGRGGSCRVASLKAALSAPGMVRSICWALSISLWLHPSQANVCTDASSSPFELVKHSEKAQANVAT